MKELSQEKYNYLFSLLTDADRRRLFNLMDEWKDFDDSSEEEIIADRFSIEIIHKGYDALTQKLFIQVDYVFDMPEYHITVKKNIFFDNFEKYYEFIDGDIYNACYYGYQFNRDDIDRFKIDLDCIAFLPKLTRTVNVADDVKTAWNVFLTHYAIDEHYKENIVQYINAGYSLRSFFKDESKFPGISIIDFDVICRCALGQNPYLVIKKDAVYPVYDDFWKYAEMKKDNVQLQQLEVGFDKHTHMFYRMVKTTGSDNELIFKLYYLNIEKLAAACHNDLSNGYFAVCQDDINWENYTTSNAELPTNTMLRRCHIKKRKVGFDVIIEFLLGSSVISIHTHSFDTIADVICFLEMDVDSFQPYLSKLRNENSIIIQNI